MAKDIDVPPRRINEIVKDRRALTVDTALRLERYFGWPAEVWLNLLLVGGLYLYLSFWFGCGCAPADPKPESTNPKP